MNAAFHLPYLATGLALMVVTALIVIGGLKRVAAVTEKLVPLMALFYVAGALIIVVMHAGNIPAALAAIFKGCLLYTSFDAYGKYLKLRSTVIFGGVGQAPQVEAIRKGVDILIACPGRLNDLIGQGHIDLSNLEVFVLDEADRMLDMGFVHDVKKVIAKLPAKRQNLMFSATMPKEIEQLAAGILPSLIHISPQPRRHEASARRERPARCGGRPGQHEAGRLTSQRSDCPSKVRSGCFLHCGRGEIRRTLRLFREKHGGGFDFFAVFM